MNYVARQLYVSQRKVIDDHKASPGGQLNTDVGQLLRAQRWLVSTLTHCVGSGWRVTVLFLLLTGLSWARTSARVTQSLRIQTAMPSERTVIGSVADVNVRYFRNIPVTVVRLLDFQADSFIGEPVLLEVRLCGNHGEELGKTVHTNIALVYSPISAHRPSGCLSLLASKPWRDSSPWQTIDIEYVKDRKGALGESIFHNDGITPTE